MGIKASIKIEVTVNQLFWRNHHELAWGTQVIRGHDFDHPLCEEARLIVSAIIEVPHGFNPCTVERNAWRGGRAAAADVPAVSPKHRAWAVSSPPSVPLPSVVERNTYVLEQFFPGSRGGMPLDEELEELLEAASCVDADPRDVWPTKMHGRQRHTVRSSESEVPALALMGSCAVYHLYSGRHKGQNPVQEPAAVLA